MIKHILLLAFCAASALGANAQNNVSYKIVPAGKYTVAQLEQGLALCTLDRYRRIDHRVAMVFDDSSKVYLFSANELKERGFNFSYGEAKSDGLTTIPNTFVLNDQGYVIEFAKPVLSSKERKLLLLSKTQPAKD